MNFVYDTYSQLGYYPPKSENVNESDYRRGKYMLQNTYAQANGAKNGLAIYHWNIAAAYIVMGQPKDTIFNFLIKSKEVDESKFCQIALINSKALHGIENTKFYKLFGDRYKALVGDCSEAMKLKEPDTLEIIPEGLNKKLIYKLREIDKLDQTDRYNPAIQKPLDDRNIMAIEAIIEKYGYPGRKLVGEKYESIAWLVIQHAELPYQEKYLPLIHKAVLNEELSETPLKMLIDRIYVKKTGLQIFGSQGGVDFADDKTIADVKAKYSLK